MFCRGFVADYAAVLCSFFISCHLLLCALLCYVSSCNVLNISIYAFNDKSLRRGVIRLRISVLHVSITCCNSFRAVLLLFYKSYNWLTLCAERRYRKIGRIQKISGLNSPLIFFRAIGRIVHNITVNFAGFLGITFIL